MCKPKPLTNSTNIQPTMMTIDSKPIKVVTTFKGTIILFKTYGFEVEKTTWSIPVSADLEPYFVESVWVEGEPDAQIKPDVLMELEGAILNHCKKNGVGNTTDK